MQRIIDTHIHIWDIERAEYPWLKGDTSILNRTWNIDEIENERRALGVSAGVLVQASRNSEDTALMLETAERKDWINGVVGWLPLLDTNKTQQLLEKKFLNEKYFKGVRHQIHDERDTKWLLQPTVIESLKLISKNNIPYDVVGILPEHIETAIEVGNKVPELKMVFDHLNAPPIATEEKFGRWGELIIEASRNKNFYAKISGLGTASGNFKGRTADDIKPYIEFVLQHFGADRCFCGGDWPVSMLADSYTNTWKTIKEIVSDLVRDEYRDKIFFSNANSFYNLGVQ